MPGGRICKRRRRQKRSAIDAVTVAPPLMIEPALRGGPRPGVGGAPLRYFRANAWRRNALALPAIRWMHGGHAGQCTS